jgi:predicted SAM-dependent methyltransferase
MKLHLGGQTAHPDWKILDIEARPEVDFVGDAADLSQFADNSIEALYASHILEHFHHTLNDELLNVLREWYRVLQPGGQLCISVPDLQTVCWLYSNPNLSLEDRLFLISVIYGGQANQYDVHKAGLDADILHGYLEAAGFGFCHRISEFELFHDCSTICFHGHSVSLNVIAVKPE